MKNILVFTLLLIGPIAVAQKDLSEDFYLKKGVAIEGYDPVSYFEGSPAIGNENFTASYNGVSYWFSSESNLDQFKKSPGKYEPQYGGWCAYAMGASGDKVKIDPKTYKITDGKLYLFYNFGNTNTLISWNKDENSLKEKANHNWQKIVN